MKKLLYQMIAQHIKNKYKVIAVLAALCMLSDAYLLGKIRVGVFCSADNKIEAGFKKDLFTLGFNLSLHGFELVTGGSNTGLMNEVVNGYMSTQQPSAVVGIVPEALKKYDIVHPAISYDNVVWVEDIHTRLSVFHDYCDYVIVAPGGLGTLHEFLDFLVHAQFGLIKKKIILLNINGYWEYLLAQFTHMMHHNALSERHVALFETASTVMDCIELIKLFSRDSDNQAAPIAGLDAHYWQAKS